MSASKGRSFYYEAMFLVPQAAASDLNAVTDHLTGILNKHHARIVALKKWDERRLAYEIKKHKRGIYFLAYFETDPVNMSHIERDANLSETILRTLVTRVDHLTEEEMLAADARQLIADEAELRRGEVGSGYDG